MFVCVRHQVSEREIARNAIASMGFEEIQFEFGAGKQCGQCGGCARDAVAQCSASCPTVNIQHASQLMEIKWQTSQHCSQTFSRLGSRRLWRCH